MNYLLSKFIGRVLLIMFTYLAIAIEGLLLYQGYILSYDMPLYWNLFIQERPCLCCSFTGVVFQIKGGIMKFVERKSMKIRESGRSSDYITPTFGHGCLYRCSYCYMRRHIKQGITTIAKNTEALINAINEHAMS